MQNLLIGPMSSGINLVVQHGDADGVYSVSVTRGSEGSGCTTVIPDLLREVKSTAVTLYENLDRLRGQHAHAKEKMAQAGIVHEEEQRKLCTIQADIQILLDTQLRNVADKERLNRALEQVTKELRLKLEELEKQARAANTKVQEHSVEIARLEAQHNDLKNGNVAARESLRKASADIKSMQAKIELLSDHNFELEQVQRDLLAQIDQKDFALAELEKQLSSTASKYMDIEVENSYLQKENKSLSAAAACDRDLMEEHIQALSHQVRELQDNLSVSMCTCCGTCACTRKVYNWISIHTSILTRAHTHTHSYTHTTSTQLTHSGYCSTTR